MTKQNNKFKEDYKEAYKEYYKSMITDYKNGKKSRKITS